MEALPSRRLVLSPRWLIALVACALLAQTLTANLARSETVAEPSELAPHGLVGAPHKLPLDEENPEKISDRTEGEAAQSEFSHEPRDGATSQDDAEAESAGLEEQQKPGLLGRLKAAATGMVAPAKEYYDLATRFARWRNEFNTLRAELGEDKLRTALDVMRLEYARVDKFLMEDACRMSPDGKGKGAGRSAQNMDFIWKILKLLIDRLETHLAELGRAGLEAASEWASGEYDAETRERLAKIEASADEASARAKGILLRSAGNLAKRELTTIAELLVSEMVANYVTSASRAGDDSTLTSLMGRIEPFVFLLGSVNTPILVQYLRNVEYRSAFQVAKYFYSALSCALPQAKLGTTTESPPSSR